MIKKAVVFLIRTSGLTEIAQSPSKLQHGSTARLAVRVTCHVKQACSALVLIGMNARSSYHECTVKAWSEVVSRCTAVNMVHQQRHQSLSGTSRIWDGSARPTIIPYKGANVAKRTEA